MELFYDIVSSKQFIEQLIAKSLLLIYIGLAFLLPWCARFVNLGISAQLVGVAVTACYVAAWTSSPILVLLSSLVIAIVLALIPVYLKHRRGSNEILTTLFLTYIIIRLAQYGMRTSGSGLTINTPTVPSNAIPSWWSMPSWGQMPSWWPAPSWWLAEGSAYISNLHLLAIPATLFCWVYIDKTILGHKTRVLGGNPNALSPDKGWRALWVTSVLSSCLVVMAVLADTYVINSQYVAGEYDTLGFLGVAIALISLGRPQYVLLGAPFVALIEMFSLAGQVAFGIPQMWAQVFYGALILVAATMLKTSNSKDSV